MLNVNDLAPEIRTFLAERPGTHPHVLADLAAHEASIRVDAARTALLDAGALSGLIDEASGNLTRARQFLILETRLR